MAEYMAKWGNKGFLISDSKVVPLTNLATAFNRKADENEDTSGTPPTNTRGLELQSITFDTTYLRAAGVDPRAQMEDWKNQFGQRYPLYINGKQFGPKLLELESVSFSNIMLDGKGEFLQVDASITLKEYVPSTTTVSSKQTSTSTSSSGTNAGALAAAPSSDDKSAKKITPVRSGGMNER